LKLLTNKKSSWSPGKKRFSDRAALQLPRQQKTKNPKKREGTKHAGKKRIFGRARACYAILMYSRD
jgi:hypothetical protein